MHRVDPGTSMGESGGLTDYRSEQQLHNPAEVGRCGGLITLD